MKIAVTGFDGRLGSELVRKHGCYSLPCDVTNVESIQSALQEVSPDVIINCAAYTFVDLCESDEGYDLALSVNTGGIHKLLDCFPGRIIHLSTDYVFTGKRGPYIEGSQDFVPPVNGYGWSKWGGEQIISFADRSNVTVVRTTGLYGGCSGMPDFAKYVVQELENRSPVNALTNLVTNQTYIPHLAEALIDLIQIKDLRHKIVHIASKDVVSRYEFATMIANVFGFDARLVFPVKSIPTWKAARPNKGGLKVGLAKRLHIPLYSVLDGLKEFHNEYK
jgi:dTDP-4-dehydrorhamnose reductase